MSAAAPLVSIVVVHWNSPHLVACLRSCLESGNGGGNEVLVVDNASSDEAVSQAAAVFDGRIRVIRTPENYGYTRGANIGLQQSRGRYVLLLNNDAEGAPGFIAELVAAAEADARIGICCPKILTAKDR